MRPGVIRRNPHLEFGRIENENKAARAAGRSFQLRGQRLGSLVDSKQRQYGDSAGRSGGIMRILYPQGIQPHQMDDALLTVRVVDKLFRIAQRGPDGKDLGGESPWQDIAGYGLLGANKDETHKP